jgi:type IV fimbrial biogenesis protein FimT
MLKPQRAFTLVELLVTIAVVAVALTLAAPQAAGMIANHKVKNVAQDVLDALHLARAEAVRRNAPVRFALLDAGWTVTQVASGDVLRSSATGDWTTVAVTPGGTATTVTFLPTGVLQAGTQLAQVTVASSALDAGTRRINIFGGGLIRMCDPDVAAANDPRRC